MAVEAGVAYISIAASTKDFARDVKSALGDFDQESRKITTGKKGFGPMLATGLKRATIAGGALVAVVGGIAIKGGIDRALGIENARAKMEGLGHSTATVDKIMDNALSSVKGTAFGLQDAATVAASAVAAGIKPGKDLERTLKAVADSATIAGTDMGSMGGIFNKVAASNKVQMDVINQLHDAGVPALALLADQMGVTAEEATKMASSGEIDFATFQAAMESGMGGAALKSGDTTTGAWKNMLAALGRVGEKLVSKVLPYATKFFGKVIDWADAAGPYVEKFVSAMGDKLPAIIDWIKTNAVPVFKSMSDWFTNTGLPAIGKFVAVVKDIAGRLQNMGEWVVKNKDWLTALAVGIGAIVVAMQLWALGVAAVSAVTKIAAGIQAAFNVIMSLNPIGVIVLAIVGLVAALVYFFTQTKTGQKIWKGFTDALVAAWNWLWEGVLKPGIDALGAAWDWLYGNVIKPVIEGIKVYFQILTSAFNLALAVIKVALKAMGAVIKWLYNSVVKPILDAIGAAWNWLYDNVIKPVVNKIKTYLTTLGDAFSWLWKNGIKPVIDFIKGGIKKMSDRIGDVFGSIGGTIRGAFNGVVGFIKGVINGVLRAINGATSGLNGLIRQVNKVPGVNFPTIPKIPMLAEGGTATSAGMSIVGDRGPEMLHLPRGASVIPLDHPAAGVGADAITRTDLQAFAHEIAESFASGSQAIAEGRINQAARRAGLDAKAGLGMVAV